MQRMVAEKVTALIHLLLLLICSYFDDFNCYGSGKGGKADITVYSQALVLMF